MVPLALLEIRGTWKNVRESLSVQIFNSFTFYTIKETEIIGKVESANMSNGVQRKIPMSDQCIYMQKGSV